ncbi:MAG: Flp pilus assembly protein CpaB [Acetobacteraceae bacterium]
MILRIMFFALMAIGLVGFGTVAWIATRPPAPPPSAAAPAAPTKVTVLTAVRATRAGSLFKPEDLAAKEISAEDARADMNSDTPEARRMLSGAMVRRSLSAGEPIHTADVMRPGDHGFLAAVLGPGMRAVTVGVDAITGSAGLIWPGDRVDLILTQTIQDTTLPIGRRVAAETVLPDVRVIAIDQQLVQGAEANGAEGQARTVTLEVTPEQAERVSVAVRIGRLSLAVRSATAASGPPPVAANGTTWAGDVSPALGTEAPSPPQNTMRVFQGSADAKEFKF